MKATMSCDEGENERVDVAGAVVALLLWFI